MDIRTNKKTDESPNPNTNTNSSNTNTTMNNFNMIPSYPSMLDIGSATNTRHSPELSSASTVNSINNTYSPSLSSIASPATSDYSITANNTLILPPLNTAMFSHFINNQPTTLTDIASNLSLNSASGSAASSPISAYNPYFNTSSLALALMEKNSNNADNYVAESYDLTSSSSLSTTASSEPSTPLVSSSPPNAPDFSKSDKKLNPYIFAPKCYTPKDLAEMQSPSMLPNNVYSNAVGLQPNAATMDMINSSSDVTSEYAAANNMPGMIIYKDTNTVMFKCSLPGCEKTFSKFSALQSHLQNHTNLNEEGDGGISGKGRPFKCEVCHQTFGRSHDLKRHYYIHSHEKPFSCSRCGKGFSRRDALRRHERSLLEGRRVHCIPLSAAEKQAMQPNRGGELFENGL